MVVALSFEQNECSFDRFVKRVQKPFKMDFLRAIFEPICQGLYFWGRLGLELSFDIEQNFLPNPTRRRNSMFNSLDGHAIVQVTD
jgi:hypothetical protein